MYSKKNLELLKELSFTQFRLKDQATALGALWSLLHPVILISVLYVVFSNRFGEKIEHYVIYLLIGVIHYAHFSTATTTSMKSLKSMKNLTKNTIFPKEIIVFSSIISSFIEFIISLLLCYVIALFAGINFSPYFILAVPLIIVLQLSIVLWISLFLAPLFLVLKDIEHIYQILLRVLFFITPIFYVISFVGEGLAKTVVLLNPLTHLITFSREIIINNNYFIMKEVTIFLMVNIILTLIAFMVFKRLEPRFAEVT